MTAGRYVKAVLWDMDGTLMDSQPLWDEAFRRCCRERGGTVTEEHVAGIAGASIERTRGLIAATGAAPEARAVRRGRGLRHGGGLGALQ